jgi:hypothetical protein
MSEVLMDEHELTREIEHYAQALSRAADEHHRERTADEVASLVSMSTTPNRLRRSVLVAVVLVVVLTAGTVVAVVAGSRSSSSHRTPPIATTPTNLSPCQLTYPAITDTYDGLNAGPGLDRQLVPIAAAKIRLCRYSRVTSGNPLTGSRVLEGAAAKSFETGTNRLFTIPLARQPTSCKGIGPVTTFVATYAYAKQRVQIYESGCGYVTNGVLAGLKTQKWAEAIARATTPTSTTEACTIADIEAHGDIAAPTPEVVTRHIAFHSGSFLQIDPPSNTQPRISAARAWQMEQKSLSPRGTYEILLGNVSSLSVQNRLAWLIVGHHVPASGSGGPIPLPGVTRPPQPPCFFADFLDSIDATTGHGLEIEIGGNLDPR